MARFAITMLWGAMSAFIIFAASDKILINIWSGVVLALVLGLSLYFADTIGAPIRGKVKEKSLITRASTWILLYEGIPAGIIFAISLTGLFFLPAGPLSALAMCLPISLITLRDYLDLSWLSY